MRQNGWIIYNGNLPGNKFKDYASMMADAAASRGGEATIIKNNELMSLLQPGMPGLLGMEERSLPDYAIFGDKDIYLARQLELLGVRVFNSAEVIHRCDDKIATYQHLAAAGLPIPRTVIAPKIFHHGKIDRSLLEETGELLGYPLILKEAFGSFGEQVHLVGNEEALAAKADQLQGSAYLLQEFIAESAGRDIRIQVVGDRVSAAMIRESQTDFRANITTGGTMQPYQPTAKECELAIAATRAMGADFAGIDLLLGPGDTRFICEVNSNAHIRNLLDSTGINAADDILAYIEEAFL